MKKKDIIIIGFGTLILLGLLVFGYFHFFHKGIRNNSGIVVNISDFTYKDGSESKELKVYSKDDFNAFLIDYEGNKLPKVYVTEFLFDGVGMYRTYDLDDFVESGNNIEVKVLETEVFNINTTNNIEFTGEIIGGMIALNSNNLKGDVNIILNDVNIDTDSKKIPAIYVYNKDITYTKHKVTIKTLEGTENYIEGGKLKKVSLIPSDDLNSYSNYYTGDNANNYNSYSSYYGVYTKSEINNILFAKVTADREDLADGDPYYYYKGSGAISSDIDLYFEGSGYLEVTSKNKEGIETKGNLEFLGGTGDYVIYAADDCLNTTTDKSENTNARNTLTINVNSLTAIVSLDGDEGDAIDSNGELIINGGTILALAHPGQDAGLDSETGTYINGGVVLATGDMYDSVSESSSQPFMVLSFASNVQKGTSITLLNESDDALFTYLTDRTYTNLIYSGSISNGVYNLYKDGTSVGDSFNGFYEIPTYTKGTQLGYSSTGKIGQGGNMGEMPNDNNMTPPSDNNGNPPEKPSGEMPNQGEMSEITNVKASNKDFTISGISNLFSGIAVYSE